MATLKDIARSIAGSNNLKIGDAETFVTAIVDTILEGLEQDRMVKIKGFGTFKLTSVRDRESVNVNTGERVTISGHDKISFTPENGVRDLINKPFIHFDTVILSDSISPEEMAVVDIVPEEVPEEPATVLEEPTNIVKETPLPQPVMEIPTPSPVIAQETPSPVVAQETPSPVIAQDTPSPVIVREEPSPVVVREGPSPIVAQETPCPVVAQAPPSPIVVQAETADAAPEVPAEEPLVAEANEGETRPVQGSSAASLYNNDGNENGNDSDNETEAAPRPVQGSSAASLYNNDANDNDNETEAAPRPVQGSSAALLCDDNYDDDEYEAEGTSNCKKVFILYAVVVNILVAIFAFVAGYYCSEHHVFFDNGIMEADEYVTNSVTPETTTTQSNATQTPNSATPASQTQATATPATENEQPATASAAENTKPSAAPEAEKPTSTTAPAPEKAKPATAPAPEKPKANEIPDQSKYNADARVRTGAYYIIGVDQTVTAREGQTLKSISRTYLGPDMECYVEALNGQKELKAGDKVKIPKLKLKKLVR